MHNVSYLKIGGFDEVGAHNNVSGNADFAYLSTPSNDSWKLNLASVKAFGEDGDISASWTESRFMIFDLASPFIQAPMLDFNSLASLINN